jgi:hypothetical protein
MDREFLDFSCEPFHRVLPVPGVILGTAYELQNPGSYYKIKKEYDVRLYCHWSNKCKIFKNIFNFTFLISLFLNIDTNASLFQFNHGSSTYSTSNIKSMTQLETSSSIGFITLISNETLVSGIVNITIANAHFSKNIKLNFNVSSSISDVNILLDSGNNIQLFGKTITYNVSYNSLGEPSCAEISNFNFI